MICLDTNFFIDLLKEDKKAVTTFLTISKEKVVTTELNYFELLLGIYRKKQVPKKEKELIDSMFDNITVLPLDHNASIESAKIGGDLIKKGKYIGMSDILIAGICLTNGCNKILTKNKKHFKNIKRLKVESY